MNRRLPWMISVLVAAALAGCLGDDLPAERRKCGNGVIDPGEECDDGNHDNHDDCRNNCTRRPPECGNRVVDPGEECDDGNSNDHDECKRDCTFNVCGDGAVHHGVEECDDGNTTSGDGCSATCEEEPRCRDGKPHDGCVGVGVGVNACPDVTTVIVAPLSAPIGGTISVSASATDADGDPLEFTWSATAGSFAAPTAAATTYTCTAAGSQTITLTVDDGNGCEDVKNITVTCA